MSFRDTPFDQMNRMMNEMNNRLAMMGWDSWNGQEMSALGSAESEDQLRPYGDSGSKPNLTVERDGDGYTVLADTPGFEREELDIQFHEGTLSISGVYEDGNETSFHTRQFHEQVSLDGEILADEITAHYRNGVLEIHVPTEDAPDVIDEGHHIEIKD